MRSICAAALVACSSPSPPVAPSPGSAAPVPVEPADPGEPVADAPAKDGSIGTAHPATLQAHAGDGSWVVVCQAREDTDGDGKTWSGVGMHGMTRGDRLAPYLVLGSGAGIPIQDVVATSDRWVAVIRDGKLELVDAVARRRVALPGADLREAEDGPRAASIAANGTRVAYLRHDGDRDQIVVRDLPSGKTRLFGLDGVLWRVIVDEAGRWARVLVVRKDTDGDGTIGWPVTPTNLAKARCRGPVGSFTSGMQQGDEPTELWLDLETGSFVEDATVLRPLGDLLLRRASDGALMLGNETIAPAACKAEIHAVSIEPIRVLAGCSSGPLEVLGPGGMRKATSVAIAPGSRAESWQWRARHAVWCDDACIDLATGAAIARPRGELETRHDGLALFRDGDKRVVFDAATRTAKPFPVKGELEGRSGGVVRIDGAFYALATGKRVGGADDVILSAARGRLLLGRAGALDCSKDPAGLPYSCGNPAAGGAMGLPFGPLRWSQ